MMEWIFSGIGTEILSFIIGAFGGGIVGYKIGISNKAKQEQKAKNSAKQQQCMTINNSKDDSENKVIKSNLKQIQKAGDEASQIQIGRINNDK